MPAATSWKLEHLSLAVAAEERQGAATSRKETADLARNKVTDDRYTPLSFARNTRLLERVGAASRRFASESHRGSFPRGYRRRRNRISFGPIDRSSSRGARGIRSSRDNPPARRAAAMLSGILNRQLTRRIGPDRRLFSSRNLRRIQFLRRRRAIVKEWSLSRGAGTSSRLLLLGLLFLYLGTISSGSIEISS